MPTDPTPDPADVELVAKVFITEAKKNPVDTSHYSWGVTSRVLLGPNEHDIARAVLSALAAAGRLRDADTETWWGWLCADGTHTYVSASEAAARIAASRSGARQLMRRAVGPWLPVPNPTTEGDHR